MADVDLLQIIDNVTSFGLMGLIVFGFFKGWLIAAPMQKRLDDLRDTFDTKLMAQDDEHAITLKAANDKIIALLEQRVEDLLKSRHEREARVEQGINMIAGFTEAQDNLAVLAELVGKKGKT